MNTYFQLTDSKKGIHTYTPSRSVLSVMSIFLLPVKQEILSPKKLMFANYNTGSLFKMSFTHTEGVKLVHAAVDIYWFG